MKRISLSLLLMVSGIASAQNAPFCLVSNTGFHSCHYWSLDACRQAQGTLGGMCSANANRSAQQASSPQVAPVILQPPPLPDFNKSYREGYQWGAEQKRMKEEHEARLRVLAAQEDATSRRQVTSNNYIVMYKCWDEAGRDYPSEIPEPGCVVQYSISPE